MLRSRVLKLRRNVRAQRSFFSFWKKSKKRQRAKTSEAIRKTRAHFLLSCSRSLPSPPYNPGEVFFFAEVFLALALC